MRSKLAALKDKAWAWLARSPIGAAARVASGLVLGSFVTYLLNGGSLTEVSWADAQAWVGAAVAIAAPPVIAWLNPADARWGRGSS